jgi:3-oxoacyl-[acyl-carrier protein] reductase
MASVSATPSAPQERALAGRIALVTGAGSGIGRAIAEAFAAAGAVVACADVRADRAEETAEAIRATGADALAFELDVADERAVVTCFAESERRLGPLAALVNNAGIATRSCPLHETPLDTWNRVLAVNLTGVFLCTRAALPQMLRRGEGAIVNVASMLGLVAAPADLYRFANYSASKGGVLALTRAAAAEYGPSGIRTNAIVPGWIAGTRLGEDEGRPDLDLGAIRAELAARTPAGRWGTPAEVAGAALYLASPAAAFVNGAVLEVDGGWLSQ